MKICIVTVYNSINSGSYWQAKALETYLKEMNYEVYFYKRDNKKSSNSNYRKIRKYIKYTLNLNFKKIGIIHEVYKKFKELEKSFNIINEYKNMDLIILGSDTIWNIDEEYFFKHIDTYWGERFKNKRIITYACSVGNTNLESYNIKNRIKKCISRFDKISVRDKHTYNSIKKYTKKEIKTVCDPTMLLDKSKYEEIINYDKPNITKPYIFLYLFRKLTKIENEELTTYAKINDMYIINGTETNNVYDMQITNNPIDFIKYMNNADYVITDTFHGTIFSIILNKQFIVIDRGKSKINDILSQFNLQQRIVKNSSLKKQFDSKIDYNKVNKKLIEYREYSRKYLIDACKKNKKIKKRTIQ